jgi:2-succinyl-6-hydroxy-2,4-cyclohexadiene-1-carboxylate synthase
VPVLASLQGPATVPRMLVALHGFTETDQSWLEVFAGSQLPIHCPLMPGHGWRPCPEDGSFPAAAAALAERLPADGSGTLLGYSMGGRVALQLAVDHPQRVGRLVLVSCRPGITDPEAREERRRRDERLAEILEEDGIGPFVAWWERQPVLRAIRSSDGCQEAIQRCRRLNQDPLGLAASLPHRGQGEMPRRWDRRGALQMPSLRIAGGATPAYLADMRRMAETMPNAQLEVFPETGHAVHREWPERLVEVVERFVTTTPAK